MDERIFGEESLAKISCCQMKPEIGDRVGNLESALDWIKASVEEGGDLIILPELCISGYVFNSREEAYSLAEAVPGGESIKTLEDAANEHQVHIVAGLAEEEDSCIYNTAVLVGPDGYIGKYRKLHLWYEEHLFFEEGDLGLPVFYTPWGRIGLMVCYDMWFPEISRIYAAMGADLLVVPTNWPEPRDIGGITDITDKLLITQAHMNSVYIAACDRVGYERGVTFKGRSIIIDPSGEVVAGPGSSDSEEIIMSDCNLSDSRNKRKSRYNDALKDRRIDVYDKFLGYHENG
ncbi:MAG: nitrilase family protein [Candidatus Bathyarchaeia archaeon]